MDTVGQGQRSARCSLGDAQKSEEHRRRREILRRDGEMSDRGSTMDWRRMSVPNPFDDLRSGRQSSRSFVHERFPFFADHVDIIFDIVSDAIFHLCCFASGRFGHCSSLPMSFFSHNWPKSIDEGNNSSPIVEQLLSTFLGKVSFLFEGFSSHRPLNGISR